MVALILQLHGRPTKQRNHISPQTSFLPKSTLFSKIVLHNNALFQRKDLFYFKVVQLKSQVPPGHLLKTLEPLQGCY